MKIKSNPILDVNLTDKIIVLREKSLSKQYRTIGNRLWKATGGFGCSPSTPGSAVYATCLGDGEQTRWNRSDVEGWLSEEELRELLLKETSMTIEQFMSWNRLASNIQ